jgi:hypothetical protein
MRKPVLSLEAARLFIEIVEYARRYFRPANLEYLSHAASDVMDGWKEPDDPEVIELRRKRIIGQYRDDCGVTWYLTERGRYLVCPLQRKPRGAKRKQP